MLTGPDTKGTQCPAGLNGGSTLKESAEDTGFIELQVPSQVWKASKLWTPGPPPGHALGLADI